MIVSMGYEHFREIGLIRSDLGANVVFGFVGTNILRGRIEEGLIILTVLCGI